MCMNVLSVEEHICARLHNNHNSCLVTTSKFWLSYWLLRHCKGRFSWFRIIFMHDIIKKTSLLNFFFNIIFYIMKLNIWNLVKTMKYEPYNHNLSILLSRRVHFKVLVIRIRSIWIHIEIQPVYTWIYIKFIAYSSREFIY